MKVLFWIPALSGPGGGAEKVLSIVASGLSKRSHDVTVASWDREGAASFYSFDPGVRRIGLGRGSLKPVAKAIGLVRLRSQLKRQAFDVAIGFMFTGYFFLEIAARGSGVPVVASEHTAFEHYRRRPMQERLLRRSASRFAAFTIPSERVREGYPTMLARRMTVIPNPVAIGEGTKSRSSSRRRILAVGNLRPEKGHELLVEAFGKIGSTHPDWDLRIVGEGPLRAKLFRKIAELGLSGRAELAGAVPDIAEEYRNADLFVMPSHYESFGLATAEALSAGVPAIGFADCPGTNEIIQDGVNGILVGGKDRAEGLAAALASLMDSPNQLSELGSRAPGTVTAYRSDPIVSHWEQLLQTVSAQGKSRP
jgi:glycosyltransferase involved in cell wall biosynthesis